MTIEDIDKLKSDYMICECYEVTFGDIMEAINNGCNTLEAIIHETLAGYGCELCQSRIIDNDGDKEVYLDEILEYAKQKEYI